MKLLLLALLLSALDAGTFRARDLAVSPAAFDTIQSLVFFDGTHMQELAVLRFDGGLDVLGRDGGWVQVNQCTQGLVRFIDREVLGREKTPYPNTRPRPSR